MPEIYDISEFKQQLEKLTGKEVQLYDREELSYSQDLDKEKLEELMRRSFNLTLQTLAVKNLFKEYVKKMIKQLPYIKTEKQVKEIVLKYNRQIEDYYEKLTIEKDLFI